LSKTGNFLALSISEIRNGDKEETREMDILNTQGRYNFLAFVLANYKPKTKREQEWRTRKRR
jgi:hypothetical protein